jgi:glucose uptake protein GlcU
MKKKNVTIIGFMMCLVVLGALFPAATAQRPKDQTSEPSAMFPRAMIMGRISDVHKIGRVVIAHAIRVRYIGLGLNMDIDHGMIRNHLIMFKESPRFHMLKIGVYNTVVLGNVLRLRFL